MTSRVKSYSGRFKIGARIGVLVCVPVLGLSYELGSSAMSRWKTYEDMQAVANLVSLNSEVSAYVHSLQVEAGASAAFVGSHGKDQPTPLASIRQTTDANRDRVVKHLESFNVAAISPELDSVLQTGLRSAAEPDKVRAGVSALTAAANDMNSFYTASIGRLLDFSRHLPKVTKDPEIGRRLSVYAGLLWMAEYSSAARANAAVGLQAGTFDVELFNRVIGFVSQQRSAEDQMMLAMTADERAFFSKTYSGKPVDRTKEIIDLITNAGPNGNLSTVTAKEWLVS